MAKPQSKSAPIDTRNLTVEQRREMFLAARKKEDANYQILDQRLCGRTRPVWSHHV